MFTWLNGDNLIWFPVFYLTDDETQALKKDILASTLKPTKVPNLPMWHALMHFKYELVVDLFLY